MFWNTPIFGCVSFTRNSENSVVCLFCSSTDGIQRLLWGQMFESEGRPQSTGKPCHRPKDVLDKTGWVRELKVEKIFSCNQLKDLYQFNKQKQQTKQTNKQTNNNSKRKKMFSKGWIHLKFLGVVAQLIFMIVCLYSSFLYSTCSLWWFFFMIFYFYL